jgi:hypothetical protein
MGRLDSLAADFLTFFTQQNPASLKNGGFW